MQLDVAVTLLESTKSHLLSYKNDGFAAAQVSAKDAQYVRKCTWKLYSRRRDRKAQRHFAYEACDKPVRYALNTLETTFFNVFVDSAIASLEDWFETC